MEGPIRKRISQVGSGAWSVYLPKKWIDGWSPEQLRTREVDLHHIHDSILIVPSHQTTALELQVNNDAATVRRRLLAAYVQGLDQFTLRCPDGFDAHVTTKSRDFLRLLDERLLSTCKPQEIGFQMHPDMPPSARTGSDLLRAMAAKVEEAMQLAGDAVESYGADLPTCLHHLQLLRRTQEEDIARLFHQAVRSVARVELPISRVTDFQLLDLIASDFERLGRHAMRIQEILVEDLGFSEQQLDYPLQHLLDQLPNRRPIGGVGRDLLRGYRQTFEDAREALRSFVQALQLGDMDSFASVQKSVREAQDQLDGRIFKTVTEYWGIETDEEQAKHALTVSRLSSPVSDLLAGIGNAARHAAPLMELQ